MCQRLNNIWERTISVGRNWVGTEIYNTLLWQAEHGELWVHDYSCSYNLSNMAGHRSQQSHINSDNVSIDYLNAGAISNADPDGKKAERDNNFTETSPNVQSSLNDTPGRREYLGTGHVSQDDWKRLGKRKRIMISLNLHSQRPSLRYIKQSPSSIIHHNNLTTEVCRIS